MLERIRQILAARALSPTQFADTIGIGRPVASHILSGRNKPSLEVIQKIVDAFPDLALPWLLKGEGPMLASGPLTSLPSAEPPVEVVSEPVVSRARKSRHTASRNVSEPVSRAAKPANVSQSTAQEVETAYSSTNSNIVEAPLPAYTPVAPVPVSVATPSLPSTQAPVPAPTLPDVLAATASSKAIRRIIIFYRDGTFSDYQPEA